MSNSVSSVSPTRAWFAFALGTAFFGYAFLHRVAPSVITNELMRDLSVGAAALGGLSAFYFYTYASFQLPVGLLIDRYGPRKLLSFALIVCAVASIGFAYSDSLLSASLYRAVIGGSVAFGFVGTLTIASYWFPPKRFAMLSGLLMTVGMFGAIAGQAPLRLLIESLQWRPAFLVLAVLGVVLGLLIFFIVPRRSSDHLASKSPPSSSQAVKNVMSKPQNWLCALTGFGANGMLLAFASLWSVPWLHSTRELPLTQAATISSAIFLGWAVGAPCLGWISDHIGRRKPIAYGGILLSIVSFVFIVYIDIQQPLLLSVLFFLNGIGTSGIVVCFAVMKEINPSRYGATALGLANMFMVGSGAILQPLLGWVLDLNWSGEIVNGVRVYDAQAYSIALSSLLIASVLSLICCFCLRETYCKPIVT